LRATQITPKGRSEAIFEVSIQQRKIASTKDPITLRVIDTRTGRPASDLSVFFYCDANEELQFEGSTDSDGKIDKWSKSTRTESADITIPGMIEDSPRAWWELEFLLLDYFQEEETCWTELLKINFTVQGASGWYGSWSRCGLCES